jgi:hypothetical protein
VLLASGAVALGALAGSIPCAISDRWGLVTTTTAAGLGTLAAGALSRLLQRRGAWEAALLAYAVALVLWEPQREIPDRGSAGVLLAVALVVPLVVGVLGFPRRGSGAAAWGTALVLFAMVACLVYNTRGGGSGIGFWSYWQA